MNAKPRIDARFIFYSYSRAFEGFSRFLDRHRADYFSKGIVLDLGSGSGAHSGLFRIKYVAVDRSMSLLALNPVCGRRLFVAADVTRLPFKDSSAESFICRSVLEHLEDPQAAVNEAYRVCRKGGIIEVPERDNVPFLYDPVNFFKRNNDKKLAKFGIGAYGHINVLKHNDWRDLFKRAGFAIEDLCFISRGIVGQLEMLVINIVFARAEYEDLPHRYVSRGLWRFFHILHKMLGLVKASSRTGVTRAYLLAKKDEKN